MVSTAFIEIKDNFDFLDDWDDRYKYIIDLGKEMKRLDDSLQRDEFKVDGCASQVWLVPDFEGEGKDAVFKFHGDSDAMIVRGLVAILHAIYDGQTVANILDLDVFEALETLDLKAHLSSQRTNGLRAMVERVHMLAELKQNA